MGMVKNAFISQANFLFFGYKRRIQFLQFRIKIKHIYEKHKYQSGRF